MRVALLSLIFVAACSAPTPAPAPSAEVEPPVSDAAPLTGCDASKAQFAVNQTASDTLVEEARKAAGATTARQLLPGQIITQEFRGDRLNLELAADGTVAKVRCG